MSPQALAINAEFIRTILTMVATVYGRATANGPYTTVLKANLACRLEEVEGGRQAGATTSERRELANVGTFRWDAEYELPETGVQIAVDAFPGKRWNPVAASFWPDNMPGIGIIGRTCDVVKAG